MPAKYHIHVRRVPPRFSPLAKHTIIDWAEGCLRCTRCVKEQCPVDAYRKRGFDRSQFVDTIDEICRDCYRCVQGCPRELIFKAANPQYSQIGDEYWTPEILAATWYQAETGKIPVSGAGYGGPFSGPGFDSFWTDMSEIVRPTRDGIHGREYISTSIDLGRKPMFLTFNEQGELDWPSPPLLELPLPILLAEPSLGPNPGRMQEIMTQAAINLNTLAILARDRLAPIPAEAVGLVMPSYTAGSLHLKDPLLSQVRALEILDHPGVLEQMEMVKKRFPELIISIKVPADARVVERVADLTAAGAEVIHIYASEQARGLGDFQDLHLKEIIRRCHLKLVEKHLRRGRHHRRPSPASRPGVPPLPPMRQKGRLPGGDRPTHRQAGRPTGGQPDRRLEQPAPGNPGGHGHAGGAPPPGRSGPGHVHRRPGKGNLRAPLCQPGGGTEAGTDLKTVFGFQFSVFSKKNHSDSWKLTT
ncbi:MAG: hypothetical protein HY743_09915 [Deltaproteobacteria bacterium]|nr:hypothetical protein [Deltaproteobacteria bacterium]